jgi:hypothetical protein
MMATNNAINANSTTPLPIIDGGTGVNAVTISPAATSFAGWDANKNLSMNNGIQGYTTTTTAAGTTTLTVASAQQQFFTGVLGQTVIMPVTATLALGQSYYIVNNCNFGSSSYIIVNSSGGNNIGVLFPGMNAVITCVGNGTAASAWDCTVSNGNGVVASWIPVFTFTTPGNLSVSYATQSGTYYQIGRIIFANFTLICTPTFTTSSGSFNVTGLPLPANAGILNPGSAVMSGTFSWPTLTTTINSIVANGNNYLNFYASGNGVPAVNLTPANFTTTQAVTIYCSTYYVI